MDQNADGDEPTYLLATCFGVTERFRCDGTISLRPNDFAASERFSWERTVSLRPNDFAATERFRCDRTIPLRPNDFLEQPNVPVYDRAVLSIVGQFNRFTARRRSYLVVRDVFSSEVYGLSSNGMISQRNRRCWSSYRAFASNISQFPRPLSTHKGAPTYHLETCF